MRARFVRAREARALAVRCVFSYLFFSIRCFHPFYDMGFLLLHLCLFLLLDCLLLCLPGRLCFLLGPLSRLHRLLCVVLSILLLWRRARKLLRCLYSLVLVVLT